VPYIHNKHRMRPPCGSDASALGGGAPPPAAAPPLAPPLWTLARVPLLDASVFGESFKPSVRSTGP
jgi:hypothetical protein